MDLWRKFSRWIKNQPPPVTLPGDRANQLVNDLSLRQLASYSQTTYPKSSVVSAYSLVCALTPLYLASTGSTRALLSQVFRYVTSDQLLAIDQQLKSANLVKTSNHFLLNGNSDPKRERTSLAEIETFCQIEMFQKEQIPAVVSKLNHAVRTTTNGLIPRAIEEIDPNVVIIIVNVIYFKANWVIPFSRILTQEVSFQGYITRPVPMMYLGDQLHRYYDDGCHQYLEKDYADYSFAMGFILPKRGGQLPQLSGEALMSVVGKLVNTRIDMLRIPRFRVETDFSLVPFLTELGLGQLFDRVSLGHLSDRTDLFVSEIRQKAVILVDEIGTESAAVTTLSCCMEGLGDLRDQTNFIADRTFMYYIRHIPTNMILFMGVYT